MTEEEKQKGVNSIPRLRTFETDIANYVKKKGVSLLDLASDQAKFKGLKFQEENGSNLLSKKAIILSVFIVMAILGGGFSFLFFNKKTARAPEFISEEPLLAPDGKIEIIIDPEDGRKFLKDVKTAIESNTGANKLVNILMLEQLPDGSKKPIGVRKFFELVGIHLPGELLDSFHNKRFMLSKIYLSGDWPVLVFQIDSYNYAFSGMLKWEKTILGDLSSIFSTINTGQTGNLFLDQVTENRDTRALKNIDGDTIITYSFINRQH
ncbi:MAG: hypothetical protein AAB890_00785, partial [Patescibacteria group bacterium]